MVLSKLNEGTTMNSWQKQTLSSMAKVSSMLVRTGQARDRTAALRKLRAMDTSLVDEEGAPIEYSYDLNPTTGRQELTWLAPSIEHTTAMSRGMYNNPAKGTTGNSWKKQVLSSQAKVPAMLVRTGQARDLKAAWAKLKGMDTSLVDEEGEPIAYSYDFNPTTRRQELTWYAPSIEHTTAMSSGMYNNPNGRRRNPSDEVMYTRSGMAYIVGADGKPRFVARSQAEKELARESVRALKRAPKKMKTGREPDGAKAMRLFHSGQSSSLKTAWDAVKIFGSNEASSLEEAVQMAEGTRRANGRRSR